jgi:hypothetical protein
MPTLHSRDELLTKVHSLLYLMLASNLKYYLISWEASEADASLVISFRVYEEPMTTPSSSSKEFTKPAVADTSYITYGEGGLTYVEE